MKTEHINNLALLTKEFKEWQEIFSDSKCRPLGDLVHKYFNITMTIYDLNGIRSVSSACSKFCHEMQQSPKTSPICYDFKQEINNTLPDDLKVTICPLGIVNVLCPIYHNNHVVAYTLCGNMVLENSFIPERIRTKYHLKVISQSDLKKLGEFLKVLTDLVHLPNETKPKEPEEINQEFLKDLGLTRREREMAMLIIKGCPNRKIGELLFVSEATVKSHVSSILAKLELENRYELIDRYGRR